MMEHPALKYLRRDRPGTPHLWCPGCGIGQIWHFTIKAIEELGLNVNQVLWVGGSGCTGRMCTYWAGDYMHTLHGRPLGFATGVKLARPELTVLCHMGDGEASAIGGNHLIQSARRNIELVAIVVNNLNYGMTGGQFSPTTPQGSRTVTSPFGNIEHPFDLCELVSACGATYVARWTTHHAHQVIRSLKKGMLKKGFAFIEVLSQCPTAYGRRNELANPITMLQWFKKNAIHLEQAKTMDEEERQGKYIIGEFVDKEKEEYGTALQKLAAQFQTML
jgi:2-oxoglutarate ferredoxin oxidoreductase subunit beta